MSLAQPTTLPDADAIAKASVLNVLNVKGEKTSFGSIFEDQRTIVVFIRASVYIHTLFPRAQRPSKQGTSSVVYAQFAHLR